MSGKSSKKSTRKNKPVKLLKIATDPRNPVTFRIAHSDSPREMSLDRHLHLELGIMLEGHCRRFYPKHSAVLRRGDVWVSNIWEIHGSQIINAPYKALIIMANPDTPKLLEGISYLKFNWMSVYAIPPEKRSLISSKTKKKILDAATRIESETDRHDAPAEIRKKLAFLEILSLLSEEWKTDKTPIKKPSEDVPDLFLSMEKAVNLLLSSRGYITVQEAAEQCGMNRHNFSRLFKKSTGMSFAKFALRYRLSGAANDLLQTNHTIAEIAEKWNFNDKSHLHHSFKKHYGLTPKQYKKSMKL